MQDSPENSFRQIKNPKKILRLKKKDLFEHVSTLPDAIPHVLTVEKKSILMKMASAEVSPIEHDRQSSGALAEWKVISSNE